MNFPCRFLINQIIGVLKTNLGNNLTDNLFNLLKECVKNIERDGLILLKKIILKKMN